MGKEIIPFKQGGFFVLFFSTVSEYPFRERNISLKKDSLHSLDLYWRIIITRAPIEAVKQVVYFTVKVGHITSQHSSLKGLRQCTMR